MASSNGTPRPLEEILAETVHREEAMDVVFTDKMQVSCSGGGGALGHPKVFYSIADKGYAECMYCDRVFVYDPAKSGQVYEGGYQGAPRGDLADARPVQGKLT